MLQRFLPAWLVLLGLLAWFFPRAVLGGVDPFLASRPALNPLFAVTMLAIGSLLPRDEIRQVARRWPTVLGGTAIQYLSMPLLAWSMAGVMGLEGPQRAGVLMAGCVPGAMASNVLTLLARGNVSYSVSLTTSATLLSPLAVPLGLWLTLGRGHAEFPVGATMWQLAWMVVAPVVVGHALSRVWSAWASAARKLGAPLANLAILWIIAVTVAANRGQSAAIHPRLVVALVGLNVGGYLAGWAGARAMRLPADMRRALTLEIGMQNAGLGTVLATSLFGPAAAIAPALYTFGCMLTGTCLAHYWAGRTSPETTA